MWAADARSPRLVLETHWGAEGVTHLLGHSPAQSSAVLLPLKAFSNLAIGRPRAQRPVLHLSGRIRATTRHRPMRLNDPEAVTRALYAAGLRLRKDEALTLQLVLGPRRIPLAVPNTSPSSTVQPWWSTAWMGDGKALDGEKRSALRTKVGDHGFACTLRLGVRAADPSRRRSLLLGLLAAVRVSEAPGLQLRLKRESTQRLNQAALPVFWPLRLGVPELTALTGWPLGDADLPGQGSVHPKKLPPPKGATGTERVIADVTVPGASATLALPIKAAPHHLLITGPTGSGKSVLSANLIIQDIAAGHSVVVIEPKGDLVSDVLAHVPRERITDVVLLDPSDSAPVGLNPLQAGGRPELVADNILSILKRLYGKNIGPRSSDILYASLLTLAKHDNASLVMLPLLLTNPGIRRSLTKDLRDPLVLQPFWAGFERWSDAERSAAVGPVLNKLRPLIRPGLRGVLGQRSPRFSLDRVFTQPTVLLVPLRRGVIGSDAADLLGSLIAAELWAAIQARSAQHPRDRKPVVIYFDEAQTYVGAATVDLADALAQSRGYNVSWVLSHQFLSQFPRDMRNAVLANARSRIVFQTAHDDAKVFERGHPELTAADLTSLGRFELYASLFAGGQVQPYASGKSRPLPPATSNPNAVAAQSRQRFGQPLDEIEAGFAALLEPDDNDPGTTGRRRRTS